MTEKLIIIPAPIKLAKGLRAGALIHFRDLLASCWKDQQWGQSLEGLEVRNMLEAQLNRLAEGDEWRIRVSPDWEMFASILRRPHEKSPYNPDVVGELVPFIRLVVDAPNAPPAN